MPTYVYQVTKPDGSDGDIFEIDQPATEPPLTKHPKSGEPVRRIFLTANLGTKFSEGEIKRKTRDKSFLESKGFTRYERDRVTGRYNKTAGTDSSAPDSIDPRSTE